MRPRRYRVQRCDSEQRWWRRPPVAGCTGPTCEIDGVVVRLARRCSPGQLFVPLVAERDGHDFIDAALHARRGRVPHVAAAAASGGTAIEVADTLAGVDGAGRRTAGARSTARSSASPARSARRATKDLAWAALAASRRTWANERSFNNEQGLPTTILEHARRHRGAGAGDGHARASARSPSCAAIARPSIGVVTRVAEAHSDRVGGIDGVARAKAELIEALPAHGRRDPQRRRPACARDGRTVARHRCCSTARAATPTCASAILRSTSSPARASGSHTPWGACEVRLGVSGRHMAHNAAAALACVGAVGWRSGRGRGGARRRRPHRDADGGAAHRRRRDRAQRQLQRQPHEHARRARRARRPARARDASPCWV